jgi:hypothetical protein
MLTIIFGYRGEELADGCGELLNVGLQKDYIELEIKGEEKLWTGSAYKRDERQRERAVLCLERQSAVDGT